MDFDVLLRVLKLQHDLLKTPKSTCLLSISLKGLSAGASSNSCPPKKDSIYWHSYSQYVPLGTPSGGRSFFLALRPLCEKEDFEESSHWQLIAYIPTGHMAHSVLKYPFFDYTGSYEEVTRGGPLLRVWIFFSVYKKIGCQLDNQLLPTLT